MVDAADSKSAGSNTVGVQVPSEAPILCRILKNQGTRTKIRKIISPNQNVGTFCLKRKFLLIMFIIHNKMNFYPVSIRLNFFTNFKIICFF